MVTETITDLKQDFYLTFGVQHSHEPHPRWAGAHPDGWVHIKADDYDDARRLAGLHFGQHFAFVYDALRFDPPAMKDRFYPRGCLAVLTDEGMTRDE